MFIERHECTVCGARDLEELFRRPYASGEVADYLIRYYGLDDLGLADQVIDRLAGHDYVLRDCRRCRAVTQYLAPDDAFAAEIYGYWISAGAAMRNKGSVLPAEAEAFREHTHAIQEALTVTSFLLRHHGRQSPSQLRILDFGAGWSRFALAMRSCGCQVSVVEMADDRAEHARRNGLPVLDEARLPAGAFDYVNTEQVLEHVPVPRTTARQLHAALAPRGILKLSVPYARWAESGPIRIDWRAAPRKRHGPMPVGPLEHLTYFRRPSLHVLAQSLGMTETPLPLADRLACSFGWTDGLRGPIRNLARLLPRRWFRNYFFFAKA